MKFTLRLIALVSLFTMPTANAEEKTVYDQQFGHAVYVAFQTPGMFTQEQISAARDQVYASSMTGDEFAEFVALKLEKKLTPQVLVQR